jgi:hypothetical protein
MFTSGKHDTKHAIDFPELMLLVEKMGKWFQKSLLIAFRLIQKPLFLVHSILGASALAYICKNRDKKIGSAGCIHFGVIFINLKMRLNVCNLLI